MFSVRVLFCLFGITDQSVLANTAIEHHHNLPPEIYIFILLLLGLITAKYIRNFLTQKKLKASMESFKMLLESTIEGIVIFDENNICIQTNKIIPQLYGYSKEELIGKHALDFIAPPSHEIIKKNMQNHNQSPYEVLMRRKDGSTFYALVRGRNILWNNKQVRISSVIDISYSKELQHQLQTLNKTLKEKVTSQVEDLRRKDQLLLHQSKLASMGEMIAAIAHQWRQPLNALNINIQNLDDDYEEGLIDKEFIDAFIAKNSQTIQFMSKTIDDFQNFYRLDKVKEHFSVSKAIETTLSIQSAQIKHENILLSLKGEDFYLNTYKSEFQQVILNILNNAKDAIVNRNIPHGKITITMKAPSIYIQDNAGGISEEIINYIFEPYFTTKKAGEGTGIGLYMSKVIIEKNMGGSLSVINTKEGARFNITLHPNTLKEETTSLQEKEN